LPPPQGDTRADRSVAGPSYPNKRQKTLESNLEFAGVIAPVERILEQTPLRGQLSSTRGDSNEAVVTLMRLSAIVFRGFRSSKGNATWS